MSSTKLDGIPYSYTIPLRSFRAIVGSAAIALTSTIAEVMYKHDDIEDDDYIGIDYDELIDALLCRGDYAGYTEDEAAEQFMSGRTDFELWIYP